MKTHINPVAEAFGPMPSPRALDMRAVVDNLANHIVNNLANHHPMWEQKAALLGNAASSSTLLGANEVHEAFSRYRKFLVKSYEGIPDEKRDEIKQGVVNAISALYRIGGAPLAPRVIFARSIKDFCFLQFFVSAISIMPLLGEVASWPEFAIWFGKQDSIDYFLNDIFTSFHEGNREINPFEPSPQLQNLLGRLREDFKREKFTGGEERCISDFSEIVKRVSPIDTAMINKEAETESNRGKLFDVLKSFNVNTVPDADIIHAAFQHEYLFGRDETWTSVICILQYARDVFFLNGFAIVLEPAAVMRVDSRIRFHSADSPAFLDNDKDAMPHYFLCGVSVKKEYITQFDRLSPKTILKEGNAEVRRVLMEKYGLEKFVVDLKVKPHHSDDFGTLYRIEVPEDEPLCMVSVINKTPEPDGSFKEYWLRVPPNIQTAQEACAWTFRLTSEEYVLAGES